MRRKFATIRDVAQFAGISFNITSHSLNSHTLHVEAIMHMHVRQAIDELRYRPDALARSMTKQTAATIDIIIAKINHPLVYTCLSLRVMIPSAIKLYRRWLHA